MSIFGSVVRQVLNEDKVTDYIKKLVVNNVDDEYKPYLKQKVLDLPYDLKQKLANMEQTAYDACVEHDMNVTHFFRLTFIKFFGLSHGEGPVKYQVGLARIAIENLGMLKENHDHNKMSRLRQMVKFINEHQDLLNKEYDADLNGLDYDQLEKEVFPIYENYIRTHKSEDSNFEGESDYEIVPIYSFNDASQYGQYTTWCVTHADSHFNSYTREGERFYFCLKHGFEKLTESDGDKNLAPMDKYGLSMISVLVDMEGNPVHITTRWNHAYNGEDNSQLHTPEQVEKIVKVDFYETFKPFTEEELAELRANGSYEEDEETRAERYFDQRSNDSVWLWDNAVLYRQFDEYYEYRDTDGYYVYDNDDDTHELNSSEVNPEPVYLNEADRFAVLNFDNDENFYCIVYEDNGSTNVVDWVTKYKFESVRGFGDFIFFIQDYKNFGCICDRGWSESEYDVFHNKLEKYNSDTQFFINDTVSEALSPDGFAMEIIMINGLHSLFYVDQHQNFDHLLTDMPPKGFDKFQYDEEQDYIIAETGLYNLYGKLVQTDENNDNNFRLVKILDKIVDDVYLVEVTYNNELYKNIIRRGENKPLIPYPIINIKYGISNKWVILTIASDGPEFSGAQDKVLYDIENFKIISKRHVEFTFYNNYDESMLVAKDWEKYYIIGSDNAREIGPFKKVICSCFNKALAILDNNVFVIDTKTCATLFECKQYGLSQTIVANQKYGILFAIKGDSNLIYAYDLKDLSLLDNTPVYCKSPTWIEHLFCYVDIDKRGRIIDMRDKTNFFEKIGIGNSVDELHPDVYNKFLYFKNGNFAYGYLPSSDYLMPTKDGVDLTNGTIIEFNPYFIKMRSKYNGQDIIMQWSLIGGENNVGYYLINGRESASELLRVRCHSIKAEDADPEISKFAMQTFFPKEKAAVSSSFNEMLDKFNKLKGGSILQ